MGMISQNDTTGGTGNVELPIDFDHLQRFTMGNRSLEREVLDLFRTQSHSCVERLKGAGDDRAWREAAHTLKGAAAGIGAWAVHEASRAAEKMQGEVRTRDGQSAIGALEAALCDTDAMIAQFLNE